MLLFSPHGIAMPKGLYFTAVSFLSFFFRRLISEVTKRISTELGHIFTYDCYLKNLVWTTPCIFCISIIATSFLVNKGECIYPNGLVAKMLFATDFELWSNISLQRNIISTIGEKLVNPQGHPYMPPNLMNFGLETAENGWRVFAHSPKFSHWETLPGLSHGRYNRMPGGLTPGFAMHLV